MFMKKLIFMQIELSSLKDECGEGANSEVEHEEETICGKK